MPQDNWTPEPLKTAELPRPDGLVRKTLFVSDLKENDSFRSSFLVSAKEKMLSRNGKPYLSLQLSDKTGCIDTRIWDNVDSLHQEFQEGDVIAVAAKTHSFQNRLQMVVSHLTPIPFPEVCVQDYMPSAREDLEKSYADLIQLFEGLNCPWIRQLGTALLKDPEIANRYKICPAAKTVHHAFIGGLLVHSLQLIRLIDGILPHYTNLDRDILVFGAAFHDFGKIFELSYQTSIGYTDEGRLVGHIATGVTLVDRKIREIADFPQPLEWQLKHLILSHHGRLEYGSPKRPHTLEAQLLHCLDDMDSKINSIENFMKAERNESRWTGHHKAYDQYYYKPDAYLFKK